ncbi:conserved hypothetical protein [Mucor ambiguus]|uniref:RhoGAP-domain-containing protein n=1 Tax=Mucor ambiguus TaxID=91626 RepID=A0A0C9MEP1_9FUNG|nr:conserved hypothetical protein [Mucor ambiguus]
MIIPTHTASTSSCSYSSHSTIDTSTLKDTQKRKSKQDLWHIIEKQRAIIQELQQALIDVTSERDDLLSKTKSIPTPPPRSPYRSNNHGETSENNYTQNRKSIPTTTTTTTTFPTQSKTYIKVKSVNSTQFSLAVMDHANLELWAIEKTKQLKTMMEDFFKQALQCQGDLSPVYSFISVKSSKHLQQQQQGYLSKRGKHIIGGWKSYYFILFESELRYFSTHKGNLHVRCIQLNHDTQVGKQANDNVEPFQHAFVIVLASAPIILGAASDTERDKWVQALLLTTKKRRMQQQKQQQPAPRHNSESTTLPVRSSSNSNHLHHHKSMYIEHHAPLQDNTRSSMDEQTILNYYESAHQTNQPIQQRTVVLKASADSLPLDWQSDEKNKKHRKSFWSRRKFFNTTLSSSPTSTATAATLPTADTPNIRHTLSFPFINNTEETSSSGSSACSTPMFQIFGVPLEAAIRASRISERYQLPAIVYRCIAYLEEKNAVNEEGIYRLSGSSVQISNLRQQFCEYGDVDLLDKKYIDVDVHVVAGLLKAWLRELPINVLTNELLNDFLLICEIKDKQSKVQELGLLVSILPLANYTLLRTLIAHLIHIVHNADTNKMTLRNVGIVFAPTLSIPSGIFTLLMSEFEYIFYTKEQQETVAPEATTSADRIKNNYLKKRSNRNSRDYKDQVPPNIISLEKAEYSHDSLVIEQDELDDNYTKQMTSFTSISTENTTATTTPREAKRSSSIKPSPSFSSSLSISSDKQTDHQQSLLFPLPSFCLYSKKALANEYAPESEIVQYLAPSSSVLEERLPMFVGVLQSLFTVVNDMPFVAREQQEGDDEEEEEEEDGHEYTDIEEEEEEEQQQDAKHSSLPFTIIGLNSMKLVIWNSMYDLVTDSSVYKKDLCLVIFVSAHLSDAIILNNMQSLKESLSAIPSLHADATQLGDLLIPLVKCWFEEGH